MQDQSALKQHQQQQQFLRFNYLLTSWQLSWAKSSSLH